MMPLRLLVLCSALVSLAASASRTQVLTGTVTNTTVDQAAPARLALTLSGETATAQLTTELPLTGSGQLAGHFRHGWLELSGKVDGKLALHFRGALNARDYRGTYVATLPDKSTQYGKFHLTLER